MDYPQRKPQRLKGYDYSQNNAYFITICTQNRLHLLGEIVDDVVVMTNAGKMIEEKFLNIAKEADINIEKHVIMPNHIHAIVLINHEETTEARGTTRGSFPTVSAMVQRFKTITTKLYIDGVKSGEYPPFEKKIWQKSFYDHIIRNEKSYLEIWQYIDENPLKWHEDELSEIRETPCRERPLCRSGIL